MALLAFWTVDDEWTEHIMAGPTVITWLAFEVFEDQVGVNYEGDAASGLAKVYGVGWWSLVQIYPDALTFAAFGTTEPRFITHQAQLVTFDPAITFTTYLAKTKVGVSYGVRVGNNAP